MTFIWLFKEQRGRGFDPGFNLVTSKSLKLTATASPPNARNLVGSVMTASFGIGKKKVPVG